MKLSAFFCNSSCVGNSFNFSFSWLFTCTCVCPFWSRMISKWWKPVPQGPLQWHHWCCSWSEELKEEALGRCLAQPLETGNSELSACVLVDNDDLDFSIPWCVLTLEYFEHLTNKFYFNTCVWVCVVFCHLCIVATKTFIEGTLFLNYLTVI